MKKLLYFIIALIMVMGSIVLFVKSLDNINFIWLGFSLILCLVILPAVDYWCNYLTEKLK